VHGQESWEEEIEETLKLVCLLPDTGEWRMRRFKTKTQPVFASM
jgi:hypothetical protein